MKPVFFKKRGIVIGCVVCVCLVFLWNAIAKNRVPLVLANREEYVSEEQLARDVDVILALYGLQKDRGDLVMGEGNAIYDRYYKDTGEQGKAIFINASPILFASRYKYTEVTTLMELWAYVSSHKFDYSIDGITYYFTAPTEPLQVLAPNELYLSRDEFLSLYKELDADKLKHHEKIEALTNAYLLKVNYKRRFGHVQVEGR